MKKQSSKEILKDELTKEYGRTVKEYFADRANYFVLPMSILEEMDEEDQKNFVRVIENIHSTFDLSSLPDKYIVMARGKNHNSKSGTCAVKDPYIDKTPPRYRK